MSFLQRGKAVYRNLKFNQLLRTSSGLTATEAEDILQKFLPRSEPAFHQKNEVDPNYDVMIIVPVYNVAPYLEQCIESVMKQQTNYTYHAIFVDDGSTDGSGEILDKHAPPPRTFESKCSHNKYTVIHKVNGGVSAARNDVLRRMTGRYVMFLDSDDLLDPNAIERLVRTADDTGADIVEGSHIFFNGQEELDCNRHGFSTAEISYRELYGFPWGKVFSSSLLKDFCFPVGYLFEDTVMATLLHPVSRLNISIPDVVYYYRDNPAGITHFSKVKPAAVDTFWMMKYCLEERVRRGQVLEQQDYVRYLTAVRRNWMRTEKLPSTVLEAIFVLSCDLLKRCLPFQYEGSENRMRLLEQAIRNQSFEAFRFLMERWDIL